MHRQITLKNPNKEYFENIFGGSRVVTFGTTDTANKASILYSLC